jgi:hypothetical protein
MSASTWVSLLVEDLGVRFSPRYTPLRRTSGGFARLKCWLPCGPVEKREPPEISHVRDALRQHDERERQERTDDDSRDEPPPNEPPADEQ